MKVWRLSRVIHSALDGEGARLYGGRWNSPGIPVVYTSSSLPLAVLETLVHTDPDILESDLRSFEIAVPDSATILEIQPKDLPRGWNETPAPPECQELGDSWANASDHLILTVPSALVPSDVNYLINPRHEKAGMIKVVNKAPFAFDMRLVGKRRG